MHIVAEDLGRRFGRKHALRGASFACHPGEIIALIGNNGAGKTTLLQLLAGFLIPTSGRLLVDGQPLDRRSEDLRRRLSVVFDFPAVFPEHTVLRHLAMLCDLHQVSDPGLEDRALGYLEEIGILHLGRAPMKSLSRGELYKTVFVGNLLVQPDLWLLDEPMASGMDPQGLDFLRARLREQAAAGRTVLYTTQLAEIAERFSDRVFVLREGELVAQESMPALLARFGAASLGEALPRIFAQSHADLA